MNSRILIAAALLAAAPFSWSAAAGRAFSDEEISGVLGAANQGEIDAADLAIGKAQNPDVKKFAERMRKEHGDAKVKLSDVVAKAGLTPADTDVSNDFTKHAYDNAAMLSGVTGEDFDRAYLNAQVDDHAALLKELDEDLIPNAKDPGLRALLHKMRGVAAHHLAQAKRLQSGLSAK
jgi:putative membrane protein